MTIRDLGERGSLKNWCAENFTPPPSRFEIDHKCVKFSIVPLFYPLCKLFWEKKYTYPTLKSFENFFIFEDALPEKGLKICPYFQNYHSKKINTVHNLITFPIVFTKKNGRGVDSTPPPPSKLGVFNTPSKLRLIAWDMQIDRQTCRQTYRVVLSAAFCS